MPISPGGTDLPVERDIVLYCVDNDMLTSRMDLLYINPIPSIILFLERGGLGLRYVHGFAY